MNAVVCSTIWESAFLLARSMRKAPAITFFSAQRYLVADVAGRGFNGR